ncbi:MULTISPECIES: hypothetical protein [unclassified Bradyrhizobium]|uniref:hypothetical protein n=1 Tax=unclassified Bradyrhizobium TaxID=2631580 RepID=UPI002478A359|nr:MULTISPECIES: hypothetical protein [unclassified Bradyrhizobium]WGR71943.1 hypothetical protein MTX24_02985 [Bradyrhizobium sp. ISRA426]WGR76777.1 hypothetical protein MTX21_27935 [Bradyrhizobium sp. ISRA430]WGR87182.1 hypothetical protein MTX25_02985 [Bradyrhizobium sp. ISRA432]
MVIGIAAIMPHARERSKRGRDASHAINARFPQNGMARSANVFPHSSLRANRSNPESFRGDSLDCFASLAMTENEAMPEQSRNSCSVGKGALFARRAHQSVSLGKVVGTLRFALPTALS